MLVYFETKIIGEKKTQKKTAELLKTVLKFDSSIVKAVKYVL